MHENHPPVIQPPPDTSASGSGHPSAREYGVGARISLHPMTDAYVDIIMGALQDAAPCAAAGLEFQTGDVSTFVGGDEQEVVAWLRDVVEACARRCTGIHLGVVIMLSRGCPGEVVCELPGNRPWAAHDSVALRPTGVRASAEWSLYPLAAAADPDHMLLIEQAITGARSTPVFAGSQHYVTRLVGDVADILTVATTAWLRAGRAVQHVTTHLSLSINSPTPSPEIAPNDMEVAR